MRIITTLFSLICLASCTENTKTKSTSQNTYGEFMVALGEGRFNKMQCLATFMHGDEDGDKMGLGSGVQVLLDTTILEYDTTAYPNYIAEKDTSEFIGLHNWTIRYDGGKQQNYKFEVKPFKITTEIPETVGLSDIMVQCNALQKTDNVTLYLNGDYTDSSENMFEIVPDEGGFKIPATFWKNVDPINLKMYFNISTVAKIKADSFLVRGGAMEITKVTKEYDIKVVH